jgi:hypothetical protein
MPKFDDRIVLGIAIQKTHKTISSKGDVMDITELTMSDLENGDLDSDDKIDFWL